MDKLTEVSSNASFGGVQKVLEHCSEVLGCRMKFAVYLPPQAEAPARLPVLYWLSGLTCNEQNFITKAGAQRFAAELGMILVCPDTSPRGLNIPGEDDSYDFGSGAGFYVDATEAPWKNNYKMFSYVTVELPELISAAYEAADPSRQGIMGHSMGGHGALICALKCPNIFKSVSAFAPICHPSACPWGRKALKGYMGGEADAEGRTPEAWKDWDAVHLVAKYSGPPLVLFIDQGTEDNFYKEKQLQPEALVAACQGSSMGCLLHMRHGYDHSYYYIASFIEEHMRYHARILAAQ